jgi:hypothetical protein
VNASPVDRNAWSAALGSEERGVANKLAAQRPESHAGSDEASGTRRVARWFGNNRSVVLFCPFGTTVTLVMLVLLFFSVRASVRAGARGLDE